MNTQPAKSSPQSNRTPAPAAESFPKSAAARARRTPPHGKSEIVLPWCATATKRRYVEAAERNGETLIRWVFRTLDAASEPQRQHMEMSEDAERVQMEHRLKVAHARIARLEAEAGFLIGEM